MLLRFGAVLGLIATAVKGSVQPSATSDVPTLQQSPTTIGQESFAYIKSLMRPVTCQDFAGLWTGKLNEFDVSISASPNGGMPEGGYGKRPWGGGGYFSKNTPHERGHTSFSYLGGNCVENPDGTVTGTLERHDSVQSTATLTLKTPNTAHIDVAYHTLGGGRSAGRHVGTIHKNKPSEATFEELIKDYKDLSAQNKEQLREVYDRSVDWGLTPENVRLVVAREEAAIRCKNSEESIRQPGVCPG